jgi:GntR family transcriptional regulator of arabinose operon
VNDFLQKRDSALPKYEQIRRDLENHMLMGKLPLGARVPTEQELCEDYEVSRITARRALEDLRESGLVDRIRGRGSFVKKLPGGRAQAPTEVAILTALSVKNLASNDESWGIQIVRSVHSLLPSEGFHATLLPFQPATEVGYERVWARIDALGSRLAGVIGFASPSISPVFEGLDQRGIPWVSVSQFSRKQTHNFVSADNFGGAKRVGLALSKHNRSSAVYISTDISHISNADKFFGFQQGWFEGGQDLESVRYFQVSSSEQLSPEEIRKLRELLTGSKRPSAVFCSGDLLASAVLKLCAALGFSVPGDVAVVGGTGIALAEHTSPTMTVLAQPMTEIGRAVEAMLVEMIRIKQNRLPGRYISCPLIERDSCPVDPRG